MHSVSGYTLTDVNPVRRRGRISRVHRAERSWLGIQLGRQVTHLCRLGAAQVKNGRLSMEYAAGCSGCSRDAVRSLVDRVGDAAHCACSPMSENWRTKDQLDCGGNDGGRPKSRHGERRGCAVNACEGLGGPAVMTGAVMRPGQLRKGHWSLANLDSGGQLSLPDFSHGWSCCSSS